MDDESTERRGFAEAPGLGATAIRDLGLRIEGTPLAPVLDAFRDELRAAGITGVTPRFYLSTEWGVPFDTIAIAIPFYLARPDLTALHASRTGHVEGAGRAELLRYLRHEMGHVVNYAYRLYEEEAWVTTFGAITQPYEEEYRPEPFDRRFVRHLPGWYAQKHPDEDWAETFAVWLTPGRDWRAEYAGWPEALAKLGYCDATMARVRAVPPLVSDDALDEPVEELDVSLDAWYAGDGTDAAEELPPGLDGALHAIFTGSGEPRDGAAGALVRALEGPLLAQVYRWTGHFPERTRPLLRALAARADALALGVPPAGEREATVALTALVTSLAMTHVHRGRYLP